MNQGTTPAQSHLVPGKVMEQAFSKCIFGHVRQRQLESFSIDALMVNQAFPT